MTMLKRLYVIYNPNSTGSGKTNAQDLQKQLNKSLPKLTAELIPTKYAGHARELAQELAGPGVMIVSSSGDGGFHEVINGVLASKNPDTVVGLLPSGNANDHYHSRHSGGLIDRIRLGDVNPVPVLCLRWNDHNLYAHSYAGVGLTADIGQTLTKASLNPFTEAWIVIKGILLRRSVRLVIDGEKRRYDSLVYAVTDRMSKYLQTGAEKASSDEFAVLATPHRSFAWLLRHLLRRTQSPTDPTIVSGASFTTTRKTHLQCDGEIVTIPAHTTVKITARPILREII